VEDPVYGVHVLAKRVKIGHVTLDDLDPAGLHRVAQIRLADSFVQDDNSGSFGRNELIDDVRADEAGPACDQKRFSANVHDQAST